MKRINIGFIALTTLLTVAVPQSTENLNVLPVKAISTLSATTQFISPHAEDTKWYYRSYNGQIQKRLWSVTENKWLTDWMPL